MIWTNYDAIIRRNIQDKVLLFQLAISEEKNFTEQNMNVKHCKKHMEHMFWIPQQSKQIPKLITFWTNIPEQWPKIAFAIWLLWYCDIMVGTSMWSFWPFEEKDLWKVSCYKTKMAPWWPYWNPKFDTLNKHKPPHRNAKCLLNPSSHFREIVKNVKRLWEMLMDRWYGLSGQVS